MNELIDQALNGDTDAYTKLIKIHSSKLYNIALVRLNNEDDANDALQETIIRIYKNLNKLKTRIFWNMDNKNTFKWMQFYIYQKKKRPKTIK